MNFSLNIIQNVKSKAVIGALLVSFLFVSFKVNRPLHTIKNGETFSSLSLLYIDNSKVDKKGGLSLQMLDIINKKADSLKTLTSNQFFLYLSNGFHPYYSKTTSNYKEILSKLEEKNLRFPNSLEDKANMRDLFFKELPFQVTNTVNLHFFVTDQFLSESLLRDEPAFLLTFFPKEIAYMTSITSDKVHVFIYYSNNTGTIKKDKIEKSLGFYNKDEFKIKLNYHIIKV